MGIQRTPDVESGAIIWMLFDENERMLYGHVTVNNKFTDWTMKLSGIGHLPPTPAPTLTNLQYGRRRLAGYSRSDRVREISEHHLRRLMAFRAAADATS